MHWGRSMANISVAEYADGRLEITGPYDEIDFMHLEGPEEGIPDKHRVIISPELAEDLEFHFKAKEAT